MDDDAEREDEWTRISEELQRREARLLELGAEKEDLNRQLRECSPRTAVMSGDVTRMIVFERFRAMIAQKLRRNAKQTAEAAEDVAEARARLGAFGASAEGDKDTE